MKLQNILLENFRNHSSTVVNCSPGINLFLGDNGEGKTNILEGISYLFLSRSFYTASDTTVLKIGENDFKATGNILSDNGVEYEIKIEFDRIQNQKSITVNKSKIDKASSLIGQFPVVILSPELNVVTLGSPSERRRFVDFVIAQSNRSYLENLIDYRRILKQRNRILSKIQFTQSEESSEIDPWTESLVQVGVAIMMKRIEFISEFQEKILTTYALLVKTKEQPVITYMPTFKFTENDKESIVNLFRQAIREQFQNERRIGYTLVGPHRDEFNFQINKLNARNYASQGQHKTFLVAMKLAEFYYLKEKCHEIPILLFDDVLSELDTHRSQRLLESTSTLGQTFITSTDEHALNGTILSNTQVRKFYVQQGRIDRVEDTPRVHENH